jgi:pyruvate kinase
LQFAAQHADVVGLSFLRRPEQVRRLVRQLKKHSAAQLGVLLKIENRMAFERLPRMLLAGLESPPLGVMVARGDLAVEMGFERLSEVEEEILWLCEAAHVPVVWATQVLETLAQTGRPSRAEVTDAAMSGRAGQQGDFPTLIVVQGPGVWHIDYSAKRVRRARDCRAHFHRKAFYADVLQK